MLACSLIDRVLPQPFKLLLAGAGLSLGMLVFFALSTAVLWNSPLLGAAGTGTMRYAGGSEGVD